MYSNQGNEHNQVSRNSVKIREFESFPFVLNELTPRGIGPRKQARRISPTTLCPQMHAPPPSHGIKRGYFPKDRYGLWLAYQTLALQDVREACQSGCRRPCAAPRSAFDREKTGPDYPSAHH